VREAQKVERLGLAFSSTFPVLFGESTELDPARFIWIDALEAQEIKETGNEED
jgi:hypothetical protein